MRKLLNILILLLVFGLASCCTVQPEPAPVKPKLAPAPMPAPVKPKPVAMSKCGVSSAIGHYPCEGCTVAKLEKKMPVEVAMNTRFDYTIKVVNPTDNMLSDVLVTENISKDFKLADTKPKAQVDDGKLTFEIGMLGPGQTKVITISGMATSTDCLKSCASVSYIIPTCASVEVVQPKLQLKKTAPAEVLLCDPIPVKFVVTNSGSGSARNVKIEDNLPAGLSTSAGQNKLVFDAGTLSSGRSRQFSATLKASKTGKYVNKAMASSVEGLKAESETTTIVRQPVLSITKTGPELRYLGRSVTYEITVANKGDAPAKNLVVEDKVPLGTQFVSASDGGRLMQGKVTWNLGTLSPERSRRVSVTVKPDKIGTLSNRASATATCAEGVNASAKTVVAGIPALLMEVIDVEDPIEVGSTETYVITVTNQGTATATNIIIKCVLERHMKYRSSSGDSVGSFAADTVTFRPLGSLAPKAKATWRVVVEALSEGDHRFEVIMNSDQLDRDVKETEATNFYK